MAMYVYSTGGEPVGFLHDTFIYDLAGAPLGRILGSRVHRFDGTYAGEWFGDMVVERPNARPRSIPAVAPPEPRTPPGRGAARRVVIDYGYADRFGALRDGADGDRLDAYSVAAE